MLSDLLPRWQDMIHFATDVIAKLTFFLFVNNLCVFLLLKFTIRFGISFSAIIYEHLIRNLHEVAVSKMHPIHYIFHVLGVRLFLLDKRLQLLSILTLATLLWHNRYELFHRGDLGQQGACELMSRALSLFNTASSNFGQNVSVHGLFLLLLLRRPGLDALRAWASGPSVVVLNEACRRFDYVVVVQMRWQHWSEVWLLCINICGVVSLLDRFKRDLPDIPRALNLLCFGIATARTLLAQIHSGRRLRVFYRSHESATLWACTVRPIYIDDYLRLL